MTASELTALQAMTEPQIRRAQDLVHAQIRMAHQSGNTVALEKLREWEDDYAAEMMRRLLNG